MSNDPKRHSSSGRQKSNFINQRQISVTDLTPNLVTSFLKQNPQFLENYVVGPSVSKETFQRWSARRQLRDGYGNRNNNHFNRGAASPLPKTSDEWAAESHAIKRKQLLDLSTNMDHSGNRNYLLHELMSACVQAIRADGGHLYLFDSSNEEIYFYDSDTVGEPQPSRRYKPATGLTVAAYVARTLESVRTPDIFKDSRFPEALGVTGIACQSVLCHPIIDTSGVFHGVFELYRLKSNHPFSDKEHEVLSLMILWGCLGIYFSQNFAQKLVDADRASLFLVDQKSNELYARIFDVGTYGSEAESLEQNKQKEIRFPMDRGIGGFVASSGHVLNIEDAYTDDRFNREIDLKTGYTTKTILCMPIFNRGSVIGIVQMVNKRLGAFTKQDEEAFETFAVYCGLALHYAKLYDKIRRSEQKYKVAIEVLTYHSVCTKDEFNKLKVKPLPESVADLDS
uniref:GAF domain-containing protein n=1 Tax=Romanomermis culicivorax TaxID=13658 RepID=A0A915IJ91_ROMCU